MTPTRRTVIKSAAWSVPVIAAAVAVPLAAASQIQAGPQPIACERLNRKGQPHYLVTYSDGASLTMHQGQIDRDKTLQALCRGRGPEA